MIEELRWAGLRVEYALTPAKQDKQFKRAQEMKAARAITLERDGQGTILVKLRDLKTRADTSLEPAEALAVLTRPRVP
jgi:histidyl-tRNA synthetase